MSSLADAFSLLDQHIEQHRLATKTPSIAIAITDKENELFQAAYGYADLAGKHPLTTEHLFEIGSVGKSFTAIALLQLYEEGKLDLQAPITAYLPWFAVNSKYEPIRIHHLLTHSAGLTVGADVSGDMRYAAWVLRETTTGFAPGTQFHYSNAGYKALGILLQELTGKSYAETIKERILDPLGMSNTDPVITHETRKRLAQAGAHWYDDRPHHHSHEIVPATWLETATADGCIASTVGDMAIYLRMLLNGGVGNGKRLLQPKSYALLTDRMIEMDKDKVYYGYGLWTQIEDEHTYFGHTGGMVGYTTIMEADAQAGLGFIVLMTEPGTRGMIPYLWPLLRAGLSEEVLPSLPSLPNAFKIKQAKDYVGRYWHGEKMLTVTAENEQLYLQVDDELTLLESRWSDHFFAHHPDFDRFLIQFGRAKLADHEDKKAVVEILHGADWYVKEGGDRQEEFEIPKSWSNYVGHYRSHNPWYSNFRVVIQKDQLRLFWPGGDSKLLVPLANGQFRIGEDEHSPEHIQFDTVVNDEAWRATWSGNAFYRFFTP